MLFRSKPLHLQHEHEDFDEIAKKSANAKVSLFQRTILYLVESIFVTMNLSKTLEQLTVTATHVDHFQLLDVLNGR